MSLPDDEPRATVPPGHVPARKRLNAVDCALLSVDEALREQGCCGFETQMLVWLSSRVDAARLRAALGRLSRGYPVVASRLVKSAEQGGPCWLLQPDAECPLQETDLTSADPAAVWRYAADLLSTPSDLASANPIRFHLLHRPDERDVFLMQYNHALMDNRAAVPLLCELNRLQTAASDDLTKDAVAPQPATPSIRDYLHRFPRDRKRRAATGAAQLWNSMARGEVITLGQPIPIRNRPTAYQIMSRCLEAPAVGDLQSRVVQTCGFPSISMAIVASVFRSIERLKPARDPEKQSFLAGIGLDLGLRSGTLALQNLISLVPIRARAAELGDREALLRMLSQQLRERLAAEADLGSVQWTALFGRRPSRARWVIDGLIRRGFSLWYGFFGAQDSVGTHFCGAAIESIEYAGPAWAPLGATLIVNQFRGRLLFQLTYIPESAPETLVHRFLDEVLDDLTAP